jgi:hypothetical protein
LPLRSAGCRSVSSFMMPLVLSSTVTHPWPPAGAGRGEHGEGQGGRGATQLGHLDP